MVHHVPSDEVVIISGDQVDATQPFFANKFIDERLALDNAGPDGTCSPRQAGDTSVDVRGCCDFEVPAFQISGTEEVPEVRVCRTLRLRESSYDS